MKNVGPEKIKKGYFEVIHAPAIPQGPFDRKKLRQAAEEAVFRYTGWPIGVVMTKDEYSPKSIKGGISAKIISKEHDMVDYWTLKEDGAYYFARSFHEDSANYRESRLQGDERKFLAFDTRTLRVAEAFIHAARLYKALKIKDNIPISFRITHKGLAERIMIATDPMSHYISHPRTCVEEHEDWDREILLGTIVPALKDLTFEVISELFVLFESMEFQRHVIDGLVDNLLTGRP